MSRFCTVCPVIVALTLRAQTSSLLLFPGWDNAQASAVRDLVNIMKRK